MSPILDAALRSWPFEPWLWASLGLATCIYARGWLALHRRNPRLWHAGRFVAFVAGLAGIFVALASPVEPFASLLLQVHMFQHLLLMMVAPPLLWLGAPAFPMLRGVPRPVRQVWIAPLFRSPVVKTCFARLTHPAVALPLYVAATWLWHTPPAYELSLRSSGWHYVQHACFLGTALLFWFPVVRPYPTHPRWSSWLLVPYLIIADVQNTILSALLTFSSQVLYPHYASVPRLGGISALSDQATAGVLMWVPGSLFFLAPLFAIGVRLLHGETPGARNQAAASGSQSLNADRASRNVTAAVSGVRLIALPVIATVGTPARHSPNAPFNLLRVPLLGRFLRWRHARLAVQLPMLALAGLVIVDGLCGPQLGPMNLAGVLPWIHWRGLLILTLLAAGNFFCMACPFVVPRTLARRWLTPGRDWPHWLRNKWLAVFLLVLFLWAYEAFSLWDSPWWTAWLALGYFASALVIDGFFRGAAFCKYVCPIGQFNFVQSLVSPLEVKVVDANVCNACHTKDCIQGRGEIPGCELHLFQPRKSGNLDCTFCLDCVHACPRENVGLLARPPGADLWHDEPRSGIGRFSQRLDLAVLVLIVVFGAFANAAGMVGPVLAHRDRFDRYFEQPSSLLSASLFYLLALFALPLVLVGTAAAISHRWSRLGTNSIDVATRYSYALVPIGFAMWLSHYSFHLVTSYDAIIPSTVRFVGDLGWPGLGLPRWIAGCCRAAPDGLLRLEIVFADMGLLLSLYAGYRIAVPQSARWSQALRSFAPWAVLVVLLFAASLWLLFQPMQMRGTLEAQNMARSETNAIP